LRDQAKAETLLGEAIKLDSSAVVPKIELARILAQAKPAEADKLIDQAIATNPRSSEALQVKGEMLSNRGDQEGAMRLFDEALKIDSKNVSALLSRANVNIALGKYKAADENIDPILKLSPDHFMANYLRGVELARQEKYAEADRIFDRISPGFVAFWPGYYVQGATKLKLAQYAQAEISLGKYRATREGRAADRDRRVAATGGAAGDRYLKPFAEKTPADTLTLAILGNAYMADRKPDLALQQFQKIAALDPDNPAIKTQAGRVAGSLLRAMGLDELVTTSLDEYEALALQLARNSQMLARLRTRLSENRRTHPLFDTACFTRNIEAAYTRMWETWRAGRPPTAFSVSLSADN
jgi:tetratricopeptide (TPR) repeat protein